MCMKNWSYCENAKEKCKKIRGGGEGVVLWGGGGVRVDVYEELKLL